MEIFDTTIQELLRDRLEKLENFFRSDVVFYFGEIHPGFAKNFRDFIEKLCQDKAKYGILTNFLNTLGGSAETVEKKVPSRQTQAAFSISDRPICEIGDYGNKWLPNMDSNHDRLLQRQPCYHYTIRQSAVFNTRLFIGGVKPRVYEGFGSQSFQSGFNQLI